jgi:hypothetical protein
MAPDKGTTGEQKEKKKEKEKEDTFERSLGPGAHDDGALGVDDFIVVGEAQLEYASVLGLDHNCTKTRVHSGLARGRALHLHTRSTAHLSLSSALSLFSDLFAAFCF